MSLPTTVDVEVWLVTCADHALLVLDSGPLRHGPLSDGEFPTLVAELLASKSLTHIDVAHSTSWRHEHGRVVLTYLVAGSATSPRVGWVELMTYLAQPTEDEADPRLRSVLAHALRHLQFLMLHDPDIQRLSSSYAPLLADFAPGLAGEMSPWQTPTGDRSSS